MYALLLIILLFYLWYSCKNPSSTMADEAKKTISSVVDVTKSVVNIATNTASAAVGTVSNYASFLNRR